jgi:hypothetical protein
MPGRELNRIASRHEDAAERHEWAARYWEERGITDRAALERRYALNERDAADRSRRLGRPRLEP